MKELALQVKGTDYGIILPPHAPGESNSLVTGQLGAFVTVGLQLALFIGGVLLIVWMVWGIFQYIIAGGNKDKLAQARKRIIFSIVGFVIIALAFALQGFLRQVFNPQAPDIQSVSQPQ